MLVRTITGPWLETVLKRAVSFKKYLAVDWINSSMDQINLLESKTLAEASWQKSNNMFNAIICSFIKDILLRADVTAAKAASMLTSLGAVVVLIEAVTPSAII